MLLYQILCCQQSVHLQNWHYIILTWLKTRNADMISIVEAHMSEVNRNKVALEGNSSSSINVKVNGTTYLLM
jgi:hypothetical protein